MTALAMLAADVDAEQTLAGIKTLEREWLRALITRDRRVLDGNVSVAGSTKMDTAAVA